MAPVSGSMAASGVVRQGTHTMPLMSTTDAFQVLPSSVDLDISSRAPAPGLPASGGVEVGGVGTHAGASGCDEAGLHVVAGPGGVGNAPGCGRAGPAGGRSLVNM